MRSLPEDVKTDLIAGAHVCRHNDGYWNSASSDQFGEQTAIKTGKGGLRGLTLSPELVSEWIDSFPISAFLSDAMENLYSEKDCTSSMQVKHKEEGKKRKELDSDELSRIAAELDKHSHPLELDSPLLCNIVNGKVAPSEVSVHDALQIGEKMVASLRNSLPSGFHSKISNSGKTMEQLKLGIKVGDHTVFDLETIFLRLLMVGQQC